jgi:anaerobic magnesium-protoporphyrin IX monomethyl ester cyclase
MRVALVRGSLCGKGAYKEAFGLSVPPLGLASLAGAIHGHKAILVDGLAQGLGTQEVADIIESWDAQVVAVTMDASPYYEFGADLAKKVKSKNKGVTFVAGGHHATFLYPQVLRNGFDYAVLGEGEETFAELIETLEHREDVMDVKGLAFLKDKKTYRTDPRPAVPSLDQLPIPAFDLFKRKLYTVEIFEEGSHIVTLETSRGCPYNCEFCSVTPMWGHRWRFKSVERILREIQLVKALGYDWVFVVDDNFIVPANLGDRELLFDEMVAKGLPPLNLIVQIRADLAARNPHVIERAAKAGVRMAFLGMESGSDEVLKMMNKGICTATATRGIRVLRENGILTHGGFIIGAPYESKKQVNKTFEYANQLRMVGLDSAQFSIYTPLPGTSAFFNALRSDSLLSFDWNLYDCMHPVMKIQMNPLWLYLRSRLEGSTFFVRKWIAGVSSRIGASPALSDRHSKLVQNATQFLSKNIVNYLKDFLRIPLDTLKLWSMFRKEKGLSKEDILEILNQDMQPLGICGMKGVFHEKLEFLNK